KKRSVRARSSCPGTVGFGLITIGSTPIKPNRLSGKQRRLSYRGNDSPRRPWLPDLNLFLNLRLFSFSRGSHGNLPIRTSFQPRSLKLSIGAFLLCCAWSHPFSSLFVMPITTAVLQLVKSASYARSVRLEHPR